MDADRPLHREFEHALIALIERFGGTRDASLEERVRVAVEQMIAALESSASDGESLSPLDVVRIRAGKLAATRVPASVFRDPARLAELRHEIHRLALAWLGEEAAQGSRFGPSPKP